MLVAPCHKCGSTDFGLWTSSSTGRQRRYCRECRRQRAGAYSLRKVANGGSHTRREWLEKLKRYDRCPRCRRPWEHVPPRPDRRYRYVWTKDRSEERRVGKEGSER